ncbi:MAG TPA: S26 family signal peptidase [Thiomicrospira sp.]
MNLTLKTRVNNVARGLVPYAIIAFLLGLAWEVSPFRIGINTTPSVPKGVYFYMKDHLPSLSHEDYVLFEYFPHAPYDESFDRIRLTSTSFVKHPLGLPGEVIDVDGSNFYRVEKDGSRTLLSIANTEMPLIQSYENLIIPNDYIFMGSDNPRGFDSRYFGLVHKSQLIGKAWLLWQFE